MEFEEALAARSFQTVADNTKLNHQLHAQLASAPLSDEAGDSTAWSWSTVGLVGLGMSGLGFDSVLEFGDELWGEDHSRGLSVRASLAEPPFGLAGRADADRGVVVVACRFAQLSPVGGAHDATFVVRIQVAAAHTLWRA